MLALPPFSRLLRNAGKLLSGEIVALALPLLTLPLLTRLLSAEAFAVYGVFSISVVFLAVALNNGVEIVLQRSDQISPGLVRLGLAHALGLTALLALAAWLMLRNTEWAHYLALLPFVLVCALLSALLKWCAAVSAVEHSLTPVALGRAGQAIATAVVSLGLAWYWGSAEAMIWGLLLGLLVNLLLQAQAARRLLQLAFSPAAQETPLWPLYRRSLLPIAAGNLLESLTKALPFFVFPFLFSAAAIGHFFVVYRIIFAPLAMFNYSLARALLIETRNHPQEKLPALLRGIGRLLLLFVVLLAVFALGGYCFTGTLLGEDWEAAGIYFLCLLPWATSALLLDPLLPVLNQKGRQRQVFYFNLAQVTALLSALWLSVQLSFSVVQTVLSAAALIALVTLLSLLTLFFRLNH